jgi:hypothetical protein
MGETPTPDRGRPAQPEASSSRGPPQGVAEWLQLIAGSAGLVVGAAALLTAVLRFACARFYTPLALRPEDVGLGVQDLVIQSLVGLGYVAVLVAIFVLPLIVVGLFAWPYVETRLGRSTTPAGTWLRGVLVLVVAALAGVIGWGWLWLTTTFIPRAPFVLIVVAAMFVAWKAWENQRKTTTARRLGVSDVPLFRRRWPVAIGVTLALAFAAYYPPWLASEDARAVRRGDRVENRPFVPWSALLARVKWARTGKIASPCALYLGQHAGTTFVFLANKQAKARRAATFPTSQVVVVVYPEAMECSDLPR